MKSEFPGHPDPAPDRDTAAAWALAATSRRAKHGQLCPVWAREADVDRCDCWILPNARRDAVTVLAASDAWREKSRA